VSEDIKPENMEAMSEFTEEYGVYKSFLSPTGVRRPSSVSYLILD